MPRLLLLAGVTFFIGACPFAAAADWKEAYVQSVKSGFKVIPQALEMEKLFGEASHFITHYGFADTPRTWNSEVYFYGRYTLGMKVDVQLDGRFGKILRMTDEPRFYLWEVGSIYETNGQVGAKIASDRKFGLAEWKKVVEAKGDFSVIGLTVHRDRPVEGFETYAKGWMSDRIRVRPDER